jgi:hypothetical protein
MLALACDALGGAARVGLLNGSRPTRLKKETRHHGRVFFFRAEGRGMQGAERKSACEAQHIFVILAHEAFREAEERRPRSGAASCRRTLSLC